MKNILIVATGGTIACVKDGDIHLDRPFKILDFVHCNDVEFECVSPFAILSEHIGFDEWTMLLNYLARVDFNRYDGVIILHGSDTLNFTANLVAACFSEKIVFVASNKPVDDKTSNGIENFNAAVDTILNKSKGIYISYDGVTKLQKATKKPKLQNKNILIISAYPNINYDNYNLNGVDAVIHQMFHSATVPKQTQKFYDFCKDAGVDFYFVTQNSEALYETSKNLSDIVFNSTVEEVYSKLILTD